MTVFSPLMLVAVTALLAGLFAVAQAGLISWRRFGEATGGILLGVTLATVGQFAEYGHG